MYDKGSCLRHAKTQGKTEDSEYGSHETSHKYYFDKTISTKNTSNVQQIGMQGSTDHEIL